MKIKLDENIGDIGADILAAASHDVSTILKQEFSGIPDVDVYRSCKAAGQVLVTLDRDFGEVIRFPPEPTAGIVVLDCRGRLSAIAIRARIKELASLLEGNDIRGHLWIVEPARLRIHQSRNE
ncbi:MAG: DUF5615 family PIN-like protein [Alphaproteobacteria bacterium]|nr:DUF5615 family PIN-like protein [Alphaproteobacteria bacterium]